jgi:translation initiation factor 1 (eIF-1/SUI1)
MAEQEIEKHIKSFFNGLIKDCEDKLEHACEQNAAETSSRIATQTEHKIARARQEFETFCEEKKSELMHFAYELRNQITTGAFDVEPVQKKRRRWLWFWTK